MIEFPVKFALVGCGKIGYKHACLIRKMGVLVACCDIDNDQLSRFTTEFKTIGFSSLEDLLSQNLSFDVLVVCTPNGLHAAHTIAGLKHGYHILCEKPMALNVADCLAMINSAKEVNKEIFIVKQNRFNPPVTAVKSALDKGKLGKILSVQLNCYWNRDAAYYKSSWRGTKDLDGGTLFTQFSHFIDLLYWMFGDIEEARSLLVNSAHMGIIEFEDTGIVALKFKSGIAGGIHYTINSFQKNMEGSLTIFGEQGTVKIGGAYLNKLEYQLFDHEPIPEPEEGNSANQYGGYQGSMSNHDKVYENLIDVLKGNTGIATNGYEGMKTVEIISKIYNSA